MQSLAIALPDKAFTVAKKKAAELGIDPASFCSSLLVDNLLCDDAPVRTASAQTAALDRGPTSEAGRFDVASEFPGFPEKSIKFANGILDAVFKLYDVQVARAKYGIEIRPNFIWIEALLSKAGRAGVRVSFYDKNGELRRSLPLFKRGQGNYSRAVVETEADLKTILPLVRRAYEMKFSIR